jgi:acetyl-CoA synthetase
MTALDSELHRFLAARDQLFALRTDHPAANAAFAWPRLDRFNWAIDYFDAIARNNAAPALHIVEESGTEAKLSYAELSRRSSQVANFLVGRGMRAGDRILLMLGNEVPLWETLLAAIKIGAVVIPATTLLSGADLADRIERGQVRWILTNATGQARVSELPAAALAEIGRAHV